ncbi:MAG: hypothetical protein JSV62_06845 [Promethearchaeota archaeon]|nr:MAG: hypothetical protein JSV62_06845 [Candidatus Lokiarchaeota archaeon]
MSNKKDHQIRELPKSLQGIESILNYLDKKNKELSSIRNISENTDLSMRVTKNILLQLEKFNQIERITEKNNILPKWRITKFGKKVIREARGKEKILEFTSKEEELLINIKIPEDFNKIKSSNKEKQELIISEINLLQAELSKTLGPILNINDPIFEDLLSFIIKKLKFLKNQISIISFDPLIKYRLKRKGEKERKVSKEEEKFLLVEACFFNSLILNQLSRITGFNEKLVYFIENESYSNAFSISKDIREEIRIFTNLINQRSSINLDYHILSKEDLKLIAKNKFNPEMISKIIEIPITEEFKIKGIEELVLNFIAKLNKGDKEIINHTTEITDSIPLYELYELILDSKPTLNFTIELLEKVINSLAENGYLPGIRLIQGDEDLYLKIVQFKEVDISKYESELISKALKLESFTLADMVGALGWDTNQVIKILNHLSEIGILKYSKSYIHGERWFIISEQTT